MPKNAWRIIISLTLMFITSSSNSLVPGRGNQSNLASISTKSPYEFSCSEYMDNAGFEIKSDFDSDLFYRHLNFMKLSGQIGARHLDVNSPEELLAVLEVSSASGQYEGLKISDFIESSSNSDKLKLKQAVKKIAVGGPVSEKDIKQVLATVYRLMHPGESLFSRFTNYKYLVTYYSKVPDDFIARRIEFAVARENIISAFIELGFIKHAEVLPELREYISSQKTAIDLTLTVISGVFSILHGLPPIYASNFELWTRELTCTLGITEVL